MSKRPTTSEFEPARLLDIFDNDRGAVREILAEAKASMRAAIERLPQEIASEDTQAVARLLHTLTGEAANIGANELSSLSGDLLEHIRDTSTLPVDLVERLRNAHDRFTIALQEYLDMRG